MAYMLSSIRSFVMILLCLNPVMIVASEYNQMHYPIPGSQASFGGEWGLGVKRLISFPDQMTVIKVIIVGFLMFIVYKNKDQIVDSIKNSIDADSYIDEYFPVYIAGPLKIAVIPLKKAAQFLFGSMEHYIYNNKIYMVGAGGSLVVGYAVGFPITGGALGGVSFIGGMIRSIKQQLENMDKKLDRLSLQAETNTQKLLEDAERNK